jgi:branched-chain amino acid transport system permease protein
MRKVFYFMLILFAVYLPFIVPKYYLHFLVLTGISCIAVLGLNVITGYTGQASLAQASFFGIAAYASALLTLRLGLSFWVAMPLSILLVIVLSVLLGIVSLRLVSHYFTICTFGLSEIIYIILNNWMAVTNGPGGIRDIKPPETIPIFPLSLVDFSSRLHYYYFVLLFVILTTVFTSWLIRTRMGKAFIAIREDSELAQAEGIYVMKYKLYSFVISAIVAAVSGALYAHYLKVLAPDMFSIFESLNMIVVLLIGGMGTIAGPILGSIIDTVIPEIFNILPEQRMIVYGLFVILFIIFLPEGLVGFGKKILKGIYKNRPSINN